MSSQLRVAVLVYPGSNADFDALHVARDVMGWDARYVFHKETDLGAVDLAIVPGGFSYGDYLRCGAIARFSPITESLIAHANRGGYVLGICNGFQILTEMGLLPGALTQNVGLRFECRDIYLKAEGEGAFTQKMSGDVLRLPIAHAEGRYLVGKDDHKSLQDQGRIAFRYTEHDGSELRETINGSMDDIAGVYSANKRVLGLMPHPERASENILGSADGKRLFDSIAGLKA